MQSKWGGAGAGTLLNERDTVEWREAESLGDEYKEGGRPARLSIFFSFSCRCIVIVRPAFCRDGWLIQLILLDKTPLKTKRNRRVNKKQPPPA